MATITKETYVRNATVIKVIDGDTVALRVDLGCDIKVDMTCRLNGIDAPEKKTVAGKATMKWLSEAIPVGSNVVVQTVKDKKEKYGRYLAIIFTPTQKVSLNDIMILNKLAVSYNGGKR